MDFYFKHIINDFPDNLFYGENLEDFTAYLPPIEDEPYTLEQKIGLIKCHKRYPKYPCNNLICRIKKFFQKRKLIKELASKI